MPGGCSGRQRICVRGGQFENGAGPVCCIYSQYDSRITAGGQHVDCGYAVDTVREMIRRRGPERYPDGVLTVLCVGRDAVEWPVLGLYLITLIGGQHLKTGMGAAVFTGKLSEKRNPSIRFDFPHVHFTGRGACVAHDIPIGILRAWSRRCLSLAFGDSEVYRLMDSLSV
jgi:hypothetical protein